LTLADFIKESEHSTIIGKFKMKFTKKTVYMILVLFIFPACATVPLSGRSQLDLIPQQTMLSTSFTQYDEFLKQNKKSPDKQKTEQVKKVGRRIQAAVEDYFREKNMSNMISGYAWEFNLVENDEMNAWCMPGGKVVVYSGILPITKDENGLAVVMGHEIAHAVARHGNERMSQSLIAQLGGVALNVAMKDKPAETRMLWTSAYGAGTQVGVLLPFSRLHESEADQLGLIFMSMAGYDPETAVDFWSRMASKQGGKSMPEFLSTHPSDETRISKIRSQLPEAKKYYRKNH